MGNTQIIRSAKPSDQLQELSEVVAGDGSTLGIYLATKPRRLLGALLKHDLVTKDIAFTAMYFDVHVDDRPDISSVGVYLTHLRRFLTSHDVEIHSQRGEGWFIKRSDKEKLRSIIEALKGAEPPPGPVKDHGGIYAADKDEYQIDDDLPIPDKSESNRKYPWAKLERAGQSVEVKASRTNVQKSLQFFRRTHPDRKYVTRNTPRGVRVWRIA